jgi:glucose uptake protein GlcU
MIFKEVQEPDCGELSRATQLGALGCSAEGCRRELAVPLDPEAPEEAASADSSPDISRWLQGAALALLAGAMFSSLYVPLLYWKARMVSAGLKDVQGCATFFSMCMGIFPTSTFWLFCGGAWKKYRGRRMEKSVMRPAILSGLIYSAACFLQTYAMGVVPYASGYAMGTAGALSVSLLWGWLAFGEASTVHNRRCMACAFSLVMLGVLALGIAT